ncbi:MAG: hypothetical protein ACI8UC_000617 [Psychromonas sp.]|jgi:hypothetical protein
MGASIIYSVKLNLLAQSLSSITLNFFGHLINRQEIFTSAPDESY